LQTNWLFIEVKPIGLYCIGSIAIFENQPDV